MSVGESRHELLSWLNDLLQLSYSKVEQMGQGSALCQIFDSIYGDFQLSKVKFDAQQEYEYVNNFKVLQKGFNKHKIDKYIPVDKLVKCKMQDNLEFLQWAKKYWDSHFSGGEYNAVERRSAVGAPSVPKKAAKSRPAPRTGMATSSASVQTKKINPLRTANNGNVSKAVAQPKAKNDEQVKQLEEQVTQLKITVDALEKERDFYFEKLRSVEQIVQVKADENEGNDLGEFCQEILDILYKTEEGFELPDAVDDSAIEQETF